ncbi:MAG TPA: beta-ketoacyl synthase N-terminal-like domain-containing protein [Pyrinomonadaceae bacterium]|jgi:3-oxoacyl-(acyl-carrier-protein) synthase
MSLQRVVITGLGIVAPECPAVDAFWQRLFSGVSAINWVTTLNGKELRAGRLTAEIKAVDKGSLAIPKKQQRYMDTVSQFGFMAAREALGAAGLLTREEIAADDIGLSVGLFSGAMSATRTDPHFNLFTAAVTAYYGSILGNITIPLGISGPSHVFLSLDLAGTDAIGYAYEVIRHGKARAMLAGGSDSAFSVFVLAGFDKAGLLSRQENPPRLGCGHGKRDGSGAVPGEGAALLVLESLESARQRGATIYGEVLGYVTSADGSGAAGISRLLREARVEREQVDCIMANTTGCAPIDYQQARAFRRVFGTGAASPVVTNITWAVGHTCGAAGAMQAVASALVLKEQRIPPVVNPGDEEDVCCLNLVARPGLERPVRVVLQNTFGFSGKTSSLLLGKPSEGAQ